MANLEVLDANGDPKFLAKGGAGTNLDPHTEPTQAITAASLPLPSGAATSAKQDTAAALLTTIDADTSALAGAVSGSELQVDVLTLPAVTGTVAVTGVATAAAQATAQTALDAIKTAVEALDNAVGGSELQVDVVTLPALPAGTNTIGNTKDAGSSRTHSRTVVTSADASAGVDLSAAPTSGQKIQLDDLFICVAVEMDIEIKEETSGTLIMPKIYSAVPGIPFQLTPRSDWKLPTADKKIRLQTSIAGNISAVSAYHSEA